MADYSDLRRKLQGPQMEMKRLGKECENAIIENNSIPTEDVITALEKYTDSLTKYLELLDLNRREIREAIDEDSLPTYEMYVKTVKGAEKCCRRNLEEIKSGTMGDALVRPEVLAAAISPLVLCAYCLCLTKGTSQNTCFHREAHT